MRVRLAALVVVVVGCRAHAPPNNIAALDAGISIAIYNSHFGAVGYAIVDDRRWVEVEGSELSLPNIEPNAELASLVIEPASDRLRIGTCTRDAELRCVVSGQPDRYLLRLVYVTKGLGYGAQHDIDVREATRATITSRFAVATPAWGKHSEVVLFDGLPGAGPSPREIARGSVKLDGSTAVLGTTTHEATAQLRRIYEGAVVTSTESTDTAWGHDSVQAVWVWLELEGVRLASGPIRVQLELPDEGGHDIELAASARRQQHDVLDAPLRLPLFVDESLRGMRQRIPERSDGQTLVERYVFGVVNSGDRERVVFVDEPLRKAARKRLDRAWPKQPVVVEHRLRTKLVIQPGATERTGYTLTYEF